MFSERQVDLPCKSTNISQLQGQDGILRLNHKCVEFGGPVTGSCQLPSHRFLSFRTHVKIEPQVGDTVFGKVQIESKTGCTDLSCITETLELCHCSFHEVAVDVGGTDTKLFSSIEKGSLLSHQFTLNFWISHDMQKA